MVIEDQPDKTAVITTKIMAYFTEYIKVNFQAHICLTQSYSLLENISEKVTQNFITFNKDCKNSSTLCRQLLWRKCQQDAPIDQFQWGEKIKIEYFSLWPERQV